jgi:hypothetical protein
MLVRMRVDVSGTRNGEPWPQRGSVIDLPGHEAAEYCRNGMAEPVATFGEVETATVEPELRTDTESGKSIRRGRPRTQRAEG